MANSDITQIRPLGEPEIVTPDRSIQCGLDTSRTPDGIAWSPDDRTLTVQRLEWFKRDDGQRIPGTSLWSQSVDTNKRDPIAVHPSDYSGWLYYFRAPSWSPNGKRTAFLGEGVEGESGLIIRTISGTKSEVGVSLFDRYDDTRWPAWSPDGRFIAFSQRIVRALTANPVETVMVREPGGKLAATLFRSSEWVRISGPLTRRPGTPGGNPAWAPRVTGIAWSPDGGRLAVSLVEKLNGRAHASLWVVAVPLEDGGGSEATMTWETDGILGGLVWLDGRSIGAFVSSGNPERPVRSAVANSVESKRSRELCHLPSADCDWSPSKREVVCASPIISSATGSTTLQVIRIGRL